MSDVKYWFLLGALCVGGTLAGCKDKPAPTLAPTASALQAAPAAPTAAHFSVDSGVEQSHLLDGLTAREDRRRRFGRPVR